MELLEGYQAPSGGVVRVLGSEPRRAGRAWRARVGLVLQSTSLDLQLTVREALGVYAGLFPRPWPVGELLELVDLAAEADTRIGQLSGGQRRRVDVGLGIVGRPELLFLDEPTTGLDPVARRQAWTAVERLTAAGTTVVLTTHYLEEAQRLADRGELAVRTTEVTAALGALAGWAGAYGLDLAGLEVGAPSLEDAYLALVAEPSEPSAAAAPEEVPTHG
jgi:ABC-2 type transport system ATP-binding protein